MILTFDDIKTRVTSKLKATASSTAYTPTKISNAVIDANDWAAGLYNWPHLEKAKITKTKAGYYYYDFPPTFLTDSIVRLVISGQPYDSTDFNDFLNYKYKTNTNETGKFLFAVFNRQYFIDPVPTVDNLDLFVFGLEAVATLVNPLDKTIFSNAEPSANLAIVKKAYAELLPKSEKKLAQAEEDDAVKMLANAYSKILKRQNKYKTLNRPMFVVPNMFPRSNMSTPKGNF